ncbi:MAG: hypothetical protein WB995_02140 [Candidatus Acidiferrales bacterium]
MKPSQKRPRRFALDPVVPVILTIVVLAFASHYIDMALDRMGIPIAATILNDCVIGVLGGAALLLYQLKTQKDQEFERARERMHLVGELNRSLRSAMTLIELSAVLDDKNERMRRIDEAMARIDLVLTDSLPKAASSNNPQLHFPGELRPDSRA